MSEQQKNEQMKSDVKKKIDKLKESITESLDVSNVKIDQLEKELHDFQSELYATSQVVTTEQPTELENLIRLYKAERSVNEVLQHKIIELDKELTKLQIDYKSFKSTETILTEFKSFFTSELAKLSPSSISRNSTEQSPVQLKQPNTSDNEPLEGLLSSENKFNKEEKLRLQSENQELQKEIHYHRENYENIKKELQFRNQEVQSLKKILQEQEKEETEKYLTKESINDEYGFTQEEEFELTKEELNTLKGKYLSLENENRETVKIIDSYKKELTDLKKVLEKKNKEIKDLKKALPNFSNDVSKEETRIEDETKSEPSAESIIVQELQRRLEKLHVENEELQKQLNVTESKSRELTSSIKKLEEEKLDNSPVESLEREIDKLRKAVWKIEKKIKVFDTGISTDASTFERHMEVYGILLNDIFNARGYALILDILLKHQGRALTKKMVMTEAKTEPHITIRILRELHDSKVIHFDEQLDQIVWR